MKKSLWFIMGTLIILTIVGTWIYHITNTPTSIKENILVGIVLLSTELILARLTT